jgi:ribosomal protein L24E
MRGAAMAKSDWRVVQIFLSPKGAGIFEVEMTTDGTSVRCNCPTFKSRRNCRHVRWVQAKMADTGVYPVMVLSSASDVDIAEQMTDPEAFRDFIIRYGKIEVV